MRILHHLKYFVLLSLLLTAGHTSAHAQGEKPRRIAVQYYFISADEDVNMNAGASMGQTAFENMLRDLADKKTNKLHVWATGGKPITLGETFSAKSGEPYKTEESEVVEVNTGEYGDDGKMISITLDAHKGRWSAKQLYNIWSARTSTTMPINSVLIVGGQSGDPLMGKKSKKKLKKQLLYFAVSVRTVD